MIMPNKMARYSDAYQYIPKHLLTGQHITPAQHQCHVTYRTKLGYFGRLESNSQYIQPAALSINLHPDKGRDEQKKYGNREQQSQYDGKAYRQIMDNQDKEKAYYQERGMANDRRPIIRILISDSTCSTKNLDHRYQAQEHKDDPNHAVAFKQFTRQIHNRFPFCYL